MRAAPPPHRPAFCFVLLWVVGSWVLIGLYTRALDAFLEQVLRLDISRWDVSLGVAAAATALLLLALRGLGDVGMALQSTVAGMELTAVRAANPLVPPHEEALMEAPPPPPPRRRSPSAAAGGARRRRRPLL